MTPDVLLRKLSYLRQLLADLAPYRGATLADVKANHYELERLFELLVMTASDVLFHKLRERGITPDSYRGAFKAAAREGLLPHDLADRLQEAAGMRNVLVHLYEEVSMSVHAHHHLGKQWWQGWPPLFTQEIDYRILRDSIEPALRDFGQFVAVFETELDDNGNG